MIEILEFKAFVFKVFEDKILFYEEFQSDLYFVEIDFFGKKSNDKLTIAISSSNIMFARVSKIPQIDFSSYDFYINTNREAEEFILQIIKTGWPSSE